jgi:hypothetical protein
MNCNAPLPEEIADFLIGRIKNLGRKILIKLLLGIFSFLILFFLADFFGTELQLMTAFICGMIFWLPAFGLFFERRNLFADLENGNMYLIENMQKTAGGYLYNNELYQPLTHSNKKVLTGYVLFYSRLIVKNL